MSIRKPSALFLAVAVLLAGAASAQDTKSVAAPARKQASQKSQSSTIRVENVSPEIRAIRFSNPPLNFIVPETLASLNEAVKQLSKDERVKVVVVTSDVPGFFINHFDMGEFPDFLSQFADNGKPMWVDLITNLANAPFVTIASIHGRTQGGGDELALAFDLRYASKEKAVFGQPEVGVGLYPGGGSTDHLTRLVGRDRALEILLTGDDYGADTAEKFGWVTRALPEAQLDEFVAKLAARLASFDRTALATTKKQVNAMAFPPESALLASQGEFAKSLSWPGVQPRMQVFGKMYQELGPLKVESNLGHYVGEGNKQLQAQQAAKQ